MSCRPLPKSAPRRPLNRASGLRRLLAGLCLCFTAMAGDFSGESALEFTGAVVDFGPRAPGSEAHRKMQDYIRSEIGRRKCELIEDRFTAQTPRGPVEMNNIIARFSGESGRAVVISGHYDTKWLPDIHFVGANDAGSSTGVLLELARVLDGRKLKHDVYLVWFDGEESFEDWSDTDGVYGSRHLARKWSSEGLLPRIIALINIDMIGDKDLGILNEYYSTRSLSRLVRQVAADLGYGEHFLAQRGAVEDDHVPFLKLGVTAVDLIDFEFGPGNRYWHTEEDTMDKLSARSLQVAGDVVLGVIAELEKRH